MLVFVMQAVLASLARVDATAFSWASMDEEACEELAAFAKFASHPKKSSANDMAMNISIESWPRMHSSLACF